MTVAIIDINHAFAKSLAKVLQTLLPQAEIKGFVGATTDFLNAALDFMLIRLRREDAQARLMMENILGKLRNFSDNDLPALILCVRTKHARLSELYPSLSELARSQQVYYLHEPLILEQLLEVIIDKPEKYLLNLDVPKGTEPARAIIKKVVDAYAEFQTGVRHDFVNNKLGMALGWQTIRFCDENTPETAVNNVIFNFSERGYWRLAKKILERFPQEAEAIFGIPPSMQFPDYEEYLSQISAIDDFAQGCDLRSAIIENKECFLSAYTELYRQMTNPPSDDAIIQAGINLLERRQRFSIQAELFHTVDALGKIREYLAARTLQAACAEFDNFAMEYYQILSGLWFRKWHIKAYFDFELPDELLSLLGTIYYRIDSLFRSIAEIDLSPKDNKELFLQWLDETIATLQKYT